MTSDVTPTITRLFARSAAGPLSSPRTTRPRPVRAAAWAAIVAQVAFVAAWIVAGALESGYSGVDEYVSELGARGAAHAWIIDVGFVLLGVAVACLGLALRAVLPRRRASLVAAILFGIFGITFALNAAFRLDCAISVNHACEAASRAGDLSWHHYTHMWLGLVNELAIVATPFALARALWPSAPGALALLAGKGGLALGILATVLSHADAIADGLAQRFELGLVHVWILIVAVGLVHATRRPRPPATATPMRPRDFFRSSWSGRGEVVGRPAFLGRFLTQRFAGRRLSTPISDAVWVVEDEATFADGKVERRRLFCELVAPDRIHVTSDDMPDGAEVSLEPDGYRVWPYRFSVPVGPVRFLLHCRDQAGLEDDGTLVDTIDFRWLGIPVARATFRMRPDES